MLLGAKLGLWKASSEKIDTMSYVQDGLKCQWDGTELFDR